MAIKLADTLAPMADFPAAMAEHIEFDDDETLQEKFDNGSLGGGGAGYKQLSQAEYDALTEEEKMNGKEYRTYDTGHIYKLGVEYGKDASADDIVSFAKPSQLGLDDASCTVVDLINAMFLEQRKDYSKRLIGIFPYVKNESNITDLPTDISSKGQVEICTSGWDMASAKFTDTANCVEYIGRTIVASGVVNSISWKKVATTITSLSELGLTADATFQDVIDALPKGGSALLGVTEFTNYQTIFPYEEGNDQFGRVYIVKGTEDGGRVYARWFRKDGVKEAIAIFNINDNKFGGWRMLKNQQVYTSIKELGLDTTATINDIIGAMKDGTTFTYKTDVFDYATEYNNIQLGTVTINKQSTARVQTLMTDKSTGDLYVGKLESTNRIVGWQRMIGENSWADPYSCAGYKRLTGTEDLFTLGTGHYVTEKANTTYNYPITDTSNLTAHIYVLGHLNDPANNKGYRIILYFDNKNRMYRINEWWGVFTDNGWQEIITKDYVDSKHNYSTTETAIGTWIDGKTIYRKTFTKSPTSNQSTGNQVTIDVATISGLTNVIDIQATAKLQNYNNTSAPIYAKIPFGEVWRSNSGYSGAYVDSVYVEGTTLKLHANSCTSDDIYYITVEYTK